MLMGAIPVVQFEGLLALDDLSADRTTSGLLLQEFCTKRRGRHQRQLSISILKVCFPVGVEWVGVALDLDMTLGFNRLLETDDVFTSRWISKAPGLAPLMGKGALGDPASSFVRVAEFRPAIEASPDDTVELRKRLATDAVAVVVRPAPEDGVERINELGRCGTDGLVTAGFDLRCDGLHTGLTGCNLQLGRLALWSGMFADGLP